MLKTVVFALAGEKNVQYFGATQEGGVSGKDIGLILIYRSRRTADFLRIHPR